MLVHTNSNDCGKQDVALIQGFRAYGDVTPLTPATIIPAVIRSVKTEPLLRPSDLGCVRGRDLGNNWFALRPNTATALLVAISLSVGSACHKTDASVTEFLRAANNGNLAKTRLLLNHNPNLVFGKNGQGFTALHYAAFSGYTEIADLLIARNADINAKTSKGDTALHYAVWYGHKDIAELLLLNKANVNAKDEIGRTPLYDAAVNGQIEEVTILLAAKADVNAGTFRGYTPLSGAASHGRYDVVRLLIDNGANVNAADFDGGTPLVLGTNKRLRPRCGLIAATQRRRTTSFEARVALPLSLDSRAAKALYLVIVETR